MVIDQHTENITSLQKRNNYTLDLSTDRRLSRIHNTFHISKIKPYVEKDSTNFLGRHDEQPGEITEGRYEVERVLEFRTTPRAGKSQYLVHWKGYVRDDDEWINFEDIRLEIVQHFWTSGNYSNTFKQRRSSKKHQKTDAEDRRIGCLSLLATWAAESQNNSPVFPYSPALLPSCRNVLYILLIHTFLS